LSSGPGQPSREPATRGWLDAILVYRQPRIASMLFLGFSAGLPFMLVFQTLSAWLRQVGIERATIGMLAWVGILYSIKFLWAPVVDRAPLPLLHRWLGRRRSWMLLAQIGVAIGLYRIAHCDPASDLMPVVLGALFIAFSSATQDIAIDAWRIESAPVNLQGAMAAAYQLGYRVAIMTGTAGALWIAADLGWSASYMTMAALMGIGVATTLLVREPEMPVATAAETRNQRVIDWVARNAHLPDTMRRAGAWFVDAVVCPIVDFFARFGLRLGVLVFVFISTYRLTDYAMGVMSNPFYLDTGYTLKEIAAVVKGFGIVMAVLGVILGGTVVAKLGTTRALVLGSVLVMCSNLAFSALATVPSPGLVGLAIVNSLDNLSLGVHGTALIAFMSSLTSARYTATQYALLSSLYALPGKLLMGTSGFVVDAVGYPWFFVYTASLSIPGLILLYWLVRRFPMQGARSA
jgi:PAT family beta-lactamase induction signal transducer AmpG